MSIKQNRSATSAGYVTPQDLTDHLKIDWGRPWLTSFTAALQDFNPDVFQLAAMQEQLHGRLNLLLQGRPQDTVSPGTAVPHDIRMNHYGQPLRFVQQQNLPLKLAYESFIAQTGQIPTRHNLHDLFNALVWCSLPHFKSMLNHRQYQQICQQTSFNCRTPLRDAITLLDENGIIVTYTTNIQLEVLHSFNWQHNLIEWRPYWYFPGNPDTCLKAFVCGHALLEQLVKPRKNLCGHAWFVQVEPDFYRLDATQQLQQLDRQLASIFLTLDWASRDLQPLPVMGIPFYCDENASPEFYADPQVFRSGRRQVKA